MMANLICIPGTESVQDSAKVEVDIIVEIVVFKKLKLFSEERGKKSKGRAVIFVASLKKKEIKEKKPTDVIVSIRKRKNQKEAGNIRKRLNCHSVAGFHRGKMCFWSSSQVYGHHNRHHRGLWKPQ